MASKPQILALLKSDEAAKRAEIKNRYQQARREVETEIEALDVQFRSRMKQAVRLRIKDLPITTVGDLTIVTDPPSGQWYGDSLFLVRRKYEPYKDVLRRKKRLKTSEANELSDLDEKVSAIRRRITLYGLDQQLIDMIESL